MMKMADMENIYRRLTDLKLAVIDLQQAISSNKLIDEKLNLLIELTRNTSRITKVENTTQHIYIQCQKLEQRVNSLQKQIGFEVEQAGTPLPVEKTNPVEQTNMDT